MIAAFDLQGTSTNLLNAKLAQPAGPMAASLLRSPPPQPSPLKGEGVKTRERRAAAIEC
jgi:hypothetical protein